MCLDDRARDRQPEPGARTRARRVGPAAIEGGEHALALLGRDPVAGIGHLELDPGGHRLGPHDDAPVGRRVADRVLNQVEQDALELLGIGPRWAQRVGHLGPNRDPLGLGLHAHRLDRLRDQFGQRHLLERPVDVAGLEPRELEQVVDQDAQRVDVGAHPAQVAATGGGILDDVVADGFREQAQRRDRRAQIMRDGRDQVPPGGLGLVAASLLLAELVDHRVGGRCQLGQLVVGRGLDLHIALAPADGGQPIANRLHVVQDPAGDDPGGDDRNEAGGGHDQRRQRRAAVGYDHQRPTDHERHQHRGHDDRHHQRELPAQRPELRADQARDGGRSAGRAGRASHGWKR